MTMNLLPLDNSEVECTQQCRYMSQPCAEQSIHGFKSASCTAEACLLQTVRHVALGSSTVKATLLTVNIKDTLRLVEQDSAHFSSFFTTLLLKTLQATDVIPWDGGRVHR